MVNGEGWGGLGWIDDGLNGGQGAGFSGGWEAVFAHDRAERNYGEWFQEWLGLILKNP
ncbi:MAG: hypothetical protein Fur0042_10160 [Cyanophyceae cyanobacterium]